MLLQTASRRVVWRLLSCAKDTSLREHWRLRLMQINTRSLYAFDYWISACSAVKSEVVACQTNGGE